MAGLHTPLLLGHRGCRGRGPSSRKLPVENSVDAFQYALNAGCDGFEFDVRYTRDKVNVLWHDPEWQGLTIASTEEAALIDRSGNSLPSLTQVLREFGSRAYLDIELKAGGNESSIVSALKETPPQRGYMVSSFYPDILKGLRGLDAELPLGFICDRDDAMAVWREMPIRVFLPEYRFVTRALIDEVHDRGWQIMTWTVNRRDDMLRLAEWGIDGIISDDPQLLYQTFQST
jgi:glycerophosphoryl diester phosphodiesterase